MYVVLHTIILLVKNGIPLSTMSKAGHGNAVFCAYHVVARQVGSVYLIRPSFRKSVVCFENGVTHTAFER